MAGLVIPGKRLSKGEWARKPSEHTLDVVAKNLAVALGSALSESLEAS